MAKILNTPNDFYAMVASGKDPDRHYFFTVGYNSASGTSREDLTEISQPYVFPSSPIQMQMVSSSADDDGSPVGTGVRSIELEYLDTNFDTQVEQITLNGITPVLTVATNIIRVNAMHATSVGSGGTAAGDIILASVGGGQQYCMISTGNNQSRQCVYTIPNNHAGYIVSWNVGTGSGSGSKFVKAMLRTTSTPEGAYVDGVFLHKSGVCVQDGSEQILFPVPLKVPAKTDIKISVESDSAGAEVMGGFFGYCEDLS